MLVHLQGVKWQGAGQSGGLCWYSEDLQMLLWVLCASLHQWNCISNMTKGGRRVSAVCMYVYESCVQLLLKASLTRRVCMSLRNVSDPSPSLLVCLWDTYSDLLPTERGKQQPRPVAWAEMAGYRAPGWAPVRREISLVWSSWSGWSKWLHSLSHFIHRYLDLKFTH